MDATNIVNLIHHLNEKHEINFASIHDCFTTQANNADLLARVVKETFLSIYADNKFIEKFHTYVVETIKNLHTVKDNKVIVNVDDREIIEEIPKLPISGGFDFKKNA